MTAKIYKSDLHDAIEGAGGTPTLGAGTGIAANMLQGTTWNLWVPDAVGDQFAEARFNAGAQITLTYFAFDVHNLDQIDLTFIRILGTNNSDYSSGVLLSNIQKADIVAGANIKEFSNTTAYQYYIVQVFNVLNFTVAPIIGVFYAGQALELPSGIRPAYTPPRLGLVSEVLNNTSEGGNFIGRSLKRKHYDFVIKNDYVSKAWIDANWNDLRDYILTRPFFYLWNDLYNDEAVFCWTSGDIDKPQYAYQKWLSFRFRCNGFA